MGDFVQKVIDLSRGKTPRKELRARAAAEEAAREPELLLPDEDAIRRQKRRELASKFRGRASTILTGRLGGPGGSTAAKAGGGSTSRPRNTGSQSRSFRNQ